MNDANKHWLSKDDITALKKYCCKHKIGWNVSREQLLMQASNGRCSDGAFFMYKKLLIQILYEMNCRRLSKSIRFPEVIEGLPARYYKGIVSDPMKLLQLT